MHPSLRFGLMPVDLIHVLPGARAFARQAAAFGEVTDDPESEAFRDTIRGLTAMPGVRILLSFDLREGRGGRCTGGYGYLVSPYLWKPSVLSSHELFWWVYPDAPFRTHERLIDAGLADAKAMGARIISFGALYSSPAGVDRFYRKRGLKPLQTTYVGVMSP